MTNYAREVLAVSVHVEDVKTYDVAQSKKRMELLTQSVLKQALYTKGKPTSHQLDVEFKQVDNLKSLLEQFSSFTNLREVQYYTIKLIMHRKKPLLQNKEVSCTSTKAVFNIQVNQSQQDTTPDITDDASLLETIEVLDISNNTFEDVIIQQRQLPQVVKVLQSMPNLLHLNIAIQSKEEEEFIIRELPNLLTLNYQQIRIADDVQSQSYDNQSERQSERSYYDKEVTLQQDDLEQMAVNNTLFQILFDNIREQQQIDDEKLEQKLQNQFDTHVRGIMKDLQQKIKKQQPEYMTQADILKAKFNLYEICFKQLIKHFKSLDKSVESILLRLHDQHMAMFSNLYNLVFNLKDHLVAATSIHPVESTHRSEIEDSHLQIENQLRQEILELKSRPIDQEVEDRLRQELVELQTRNLELENENKKYIQLIIKHSKMSTQQSEKVLSNYSSSYSQIERKPKGQMMTLVAPNSIRTLTLKQLKDTINEIYESKLKFDQKCLDAKLPRETMQQHMYTYLNQKYGLNNLVIEWAASIITSIKTFACEDNDVAVFGKILRNECDEEFRFVQTQVKNTMQQLLKMHLRGKYSLKPEAEIKEILHSRINGQIFIEEALDIIKYMYGEEDAENLQNKLKQLASSQSRIVDKKITRAEQQLHEKEKPKLEYSVVLKTILDFQLKFHEQYLKKFCDNFNSIDNDQNGIINEDEFKQLITSFNLDISEKDCQAFLNELDPYNHQQITFSQCVYLLSNRVIHGQLTILQQIYSQ